MSRRILDPVPGLLAGLLAASVTLPVSAGTVYQWKDAQGVTHFSDAPPPDRKGYTNRQIRDAAPASQSPAQATEDPACTTARRNLEHLKGDRPVGLDADKDGKPDKEMTTEERASQVALAEATLRAYCTAATARP